jgi:hypothetical protein
MLNVANSPSGSFNERLNNWVLKLLWNLLYTPLPRGSFSAGGSLSEVWAKMGGLGNFPQGLAKVA